MEDPLSFVAKEIPADGMRQKNFEPDGWFQILDKTGNPADQVAVYGGTAAPGMAGWHIR
jgi:hypothetical protein